MSSQFNLLSIPGYLFTGLAGMLFILVPPTSVSAFYIHYNILFIEIFGIFFVIGGFTSLSAVVARKLFKASVIPTWYFEMAGLFLTIAASAIYSYSLCTRGVQTGDINTFALGVLFIGITFEFLRRLWEIHSLTRQMLAVPGEREIA